MGIVLDFRAVRRRNSPKRDTADASAQVIIFPGVRYERIEAKPPAGWSPAEWLSAQQPQLLPQG